MNFDLSEEQELLQETVRQYVQNECGLVRLHELFDGEDVHDPALWQGMAELGLAGIHIGETYGGGDLELLDLALVAEVLGHAATPGPFLPHALAALAIEAGGSDAQKSTWLPRLATGDAIGSIALGEGEAGWQPEEWTLEGGATLTGTKRNVPFGSIADVLVVGLRGGELALVERSAAGVKVEPLAGVDRTRRIDAVHFDGAACDALPGGAAAAPRVRDAGLVLLAADAFGGASRCVEMAVDYARTREQFGVTIGHFQGLKHQLANLATEVEPARALYWYAAHAFDHVPEDAERAAALAKSHVTEVYMQAARDTVEAHGGIGYTWEGDVQIWFKRAMFDRAFLGQPALHRERAAALAGW